jgi:hypothetical protein
MTRTSITKSRDLRWFCKCTVRALSFSMKLVEFYSITVIYIFKNALHDFSMTLYVYISSSVSSRRHIIFKHNTQFTDKEFGKAIIAQCTNTQPKDFILL